MKFYFFIGMLLFLLSGQSFSQAPGFAWAHKISSSGGQVSYIYESRFDASGNIIVAGNFTGSPDFDFGPGTTIVSSVSLKDIFVAKYTPAGALIWVKRIGGNADDYCYSMDTDASGNICLAGNFVGVCDFDPGPGVYNLTGGTMYIVKLNSAGNFLWAKVFSGVSVQDKAERIRCSPTGSVYFTGEFRDSVDFDPGPGILRLHAAGQTDHFILKLTSTGNLAWAGRTGGTDYDLAPGLVLDNAGRIYYGGQFKGTADLNPGTAVNNHGPATYPRAFVTCVDTLGNFIWAVSFSGYYNYMTSMTLTPDNNLLLGGRFSQTMDANPGAATSNLNATPSGTVVFTEDCFVIKLSLSGGLVWAKSFGGPQNDNIWDVEADPAGKIFVTGQSQPGCDFDPGPGVVTIADTSFQDVYLSSLNNSNGSFNWALNFPNTGVVDYAWDIKSDGSGSIYLMGNFAGPLDFNPFAGVYPMTSVGNYDAFLLKLANCSVPGSQSTVSACSPYNWNGNSLTSSGTYNDTLPNLSGCDSAVTLNLTILPSSFSTATVQSCSSFTWLGNVYSSSGVYSDTLSNAVGCDSILTLNLTISSNSYSTQNVQSCGPYSWQGNIYSSSGTYNAILQNAAGCDSMLTLNLTVNSGSSSTQNITACDTYSWQGNIYSSSGTYNALLQNAAGCDSLVTLNLTINSSSSSVQTAQGCNNYTWQGNVYSTSGTYFTIIPNAAGCDSAMQLNLTIVPLITWANLSGNTLTAITSGAAYQWVDCNNGFQPIPGATSQSYTAAANGSYAVILTLNGCSDTSSCYTVVVTGNFDGQVTRLLSISPNPGAGEFSLHFFSPSAGPGTMSITDLAGKTVFSQKIISESGDNELMTVLPELPAGVYAVCLTLPSGTFTAKWVRE